MASSWNSCKFPLFLLLQSALKSSSMFMFNQLDYYLEDNTHFRLSNRFHPNIIWVGPIPELDFWLQKSKNNLLESSASRLEEKCRPLIVGASVGRSEICLNRASVKSSFSVIPSREQLKARPFPWSTFNSTYCVGGSFSHLACSLLHFFVLSSKLEFSKEVAAARVESGRREINWGNLERRRE